MGIRTKTMLTTAAVTASLIVGIATPAAAAPPEVTAADPIAVSGGTKRFSDVPKTHKFYAAITWMYSEGLTTGIQKGSKVVYNGSGRLTREAMAAFLYRQAGSPSFTMPKKNFIDVPKTHKFYKQIMWMYAEGLTTGVQTSKGIAFQPSSRLSREAMAAFLYRQAGKPALTSSTTFSDVPKTHKFYRPIAWMRETGLSTGIRQDDGTITYSPKNRISREAMAAFLYRQSGTPDFVDSGSLTVVGTTSVGKTVTARTTGWAPATVEYSYQWLANGAAISGATTADLELAASLEGKRVQVKVKATVEGTRAVTMTSASKTVAPKGLDPVEGTKPSIQGVVQVDRTVTANIGAWSVAPTVTWHVDGVQAGTGETFTVLPAHAGKKLTVKATASATGYATTSLTSSSKTVAYGQITGTTPVIEGPVRVAETATANVGQWSVTPKLYWVRDLTQRLNAGKTLNPDDDLDFVGGSTGCNATCTISSVPKTMTLVAIADAPGYERLTLISEEYLVGGLDTEAVEQIIFQQINDYRTSQGFQALVRDDQLTLGARTWVQHLNDLNQLSHSTVEWRNQYATTTWGTGENLHRSCGSTLTSASSKATAAVNQWLASTSHLQNIRTASWDTTGIGVDARSYETTTTTPWGTETTETMWCVTSSQIFENR